MSKFIIEGGHPLRGTITASGNKNAALKLIPACILTDEPVILHNIPNIQDVRNTILILRDLGASVEDLGGGSWRIHAQNIDQNRIGSKRWPAVPGPRLSFPGQCWPGWAR